MSDFKTLPQMLMDVQHSYSHSKAFNYKRNGHWVPLSTSAFIDQVQRFCLGLITLGLKPGRGFAIIAPSSPHWLIADFASQINRAITVPLFPNVSPENFLFQIKDSNCDFLLIHKFSELEPHIKNQLHLFKKVICLEGIHPENAISYNEVLRLGDQNADANPELFAQMVASVKPEDLATIIYTSGSTGVPKGVELTHSNLISQIKGTKIRFPVFANSDKALSCLPLAHIFERMVTYYFIYCGVRVWYADDVKKLGPILKDIQPTVVTLVPRIFEKLHAKLTGSLDEKKGISKILLKLAIQKASSPTQDSGLLFNLLDRLVYNKMRAALGSNLRLIISGGSKLNPEIGNFLVKVGFPIFEGYGLTEASPVIAANYPGNSKMGTVGKVFPYVQVKISESGEILAKGPGIMRGYHNAPRESASAFTDDGWLRTGDLGSMDNEGYLTITGRIKEFFKTSTGKYVTPVPIEQKLTQHPLIDVAMVIAENRSYVSCILFPDFANLQAQKQKRNLALISDSEFLQSAGVHKEIENHIQAVNSHLNQWEQIRNFYLSTRPASTETGELTPTLKIRRQQVEEQFKNVIDDFYSKSDF
jgi:long-chain acyl-CoA synthetase